MKKIKSYCKLLSVISIAFLMCFGGVLSSYASARSAEEIVSDLYSGGLLLNLKGIGMRVNIFGPKKSGDGGWELFQKIASEKLPVDSDPDPEKLDSAHVLCLLLHVYDTVLKMKIDSKCAGSAVQNIWYGHRSPHEMSVDKTVLEELIELREEYKVLKPLLFGSL